MKKRKKVWVLDVSCNLEDGYDSEILLFSSLIKAQKEMSKCIAEDFNNTLLTRFEHFNYIDANGNLVKNKVPYEVFIKEPINSKYCILYSDYSDHSIIYTIYKMPIC
jgi:hypothetical protein